MPQPHPELLSLIDEMKLITVPAASLVPEQDLYELGLTSFGSVQLMLALEDRFGVEFADTMMNRKTFQTLSSIENALSTLAVGG